MKEFYDYIVLGAGYGGLSSAALLARNGYSVLILESHTAIGGCASFYRRKNFVFDVGATTFSGVLPHQPIGKLFNELSIKPKLLKLDPGMIVRIGDVDIRRDADINIWIDRAVDLFGSKNQKKFWLEIFDINNRAWKFISENKVIPPSSLKELLKLIKFSNISSANLIPAIFTSVKKQIMRYSLNTELFNKFIAEQLLITTQNNVSDSPLLTSAMGLAYPAETYYPYGGMTKPGEKILEKFQQSGGRIKFKRKVTKITRKKDYYIVTAGKDELYQARGIISSIPIWNMALITEGNIRNYFTAKSKLFDFSWGAFTINFGIKRRKELETAYYQIHTDETIVNCNSKSFFVSFSLKDDYERAPEGWCSVTISTHTDVRNWQGLTKDEYLHKKRLTEAAILSKFDEVFREYFEDERILSFIRHTLHL